MIYSKEIVNKIINLISEGVTLRDAASISGVSETQVHEWKKKYPKFAKSYKKARLQYKWSLVKDIRRDKSWTSKAWILERQFSKEWSKDRILEERITALEKRINY